MIVERVDSLTAVAELVKMWAGTGLTELVKAGSVIFDQFHGTGQIVKRDL